MKTGRLFWGFFLLSLGAFYLLRNFDVMSFEVEHIWRYWPVLLIVWGISYLQVPKIIKQLLAASSGVLLAVLIINLCSFNWSRCNIGKDLNVQFDVFDDVRQILPFGTENLLVDCSDSVSKAEFYFDGGAGEFSIGGETQNLVNVDAVSHGDGSNLRYTFDSVSRTAKVYFSFGDGKVWKRLGGKRYADIKLNSGPVWSVDIDAGACEFDLDLSKYKISSVDIDAGAADIDLKLGELFDTCLVDIGTGAANVGISISKNVGCEIITDTGLSNSNFNGFVKEGGSKYRTANFLTAEKKVMMNISGGVSNFEVTRY